MRRVMLTVLAAGLAVLFVSCKPDQSDQAGAPAVNKQARITITYVPATLSTPMQLTVDAPEDGIKISKNNQDTIKWKVKYDGPPSANPADITLNNFTDYAGATNPFGDGSAPHNEFKFDPTSGGGEKTKDTLPANQTGVFRYRITVTLPDNGPVIRVDPVVIIDN